MHVRTAGALALVFSITIVLSIFHIFATTTLTTGWNWNRVFSRHDAAGFNGDLLNYPISKNEASLFRETSTLKANNRTPLIFFWSPVVTEAFDDLPQTYFSDKELSCSKSVGRCIFSHQRVLLSKADVVILSMQQWHPAPWDKLPKRPGNQIWAFFENESPAHLYSWNWRNSRDEKDKRIRQLNSTFNWTITYRLDSTIPVPYGRIIARQKPDYSRNFNRFAMEKSVMALFMASNCGNRMSHRSEYAQELVNHGVEVEVIGACPVLDLTSPLATDPDCRRTNVWDTLPACLQKINRRYKFYLSFENSLCLDYVTEKFYRAAALDLIPVVLSGANMSLFAPPHSYIDAKDFRGPKQLAEYLLKVADDEELYNSYFAWKPYFDVINMMEGMLYKRTLCHICDAAQRLLAEPTKQPKWYEDLEDWWVNVGNCTEGKEIWFDEQSGNF